MLPLPPRSLGLYSQRAEEEKLTVGTYCLVFSQWGKTWSKHCPAEFMHLSLGKTSKKSIPKEKKASIKACFQVYWITWGSWHSHNMKGSKCSWTGFRKCPVALGPLLLIEVQISSWMNLASVLKFWIIYYYLKYFTEYWLNTVPAVSQRMVHPSHLSKNFSLSSQTCFVKLM